MAPKRRNTRDELALALRRLRAQQNDLSQQDAAVRCGLHTRYWQKMEASDANPTLDTLGVICTAFGVNLADLLTETKSDAQAEPHEKSRSRATRRRVG